MKGRSEGEDDGVKEEEMLRWGKKVGMGQVAIEESPESRVGRRPARRRPKEMG